MCIISRHERKGKLALNTIDDIKSTQKYTHPYGTSGYLCKRVKAAEAVFCSARKEKTHCGEKYLVLAYSDGHL